MKSQLEIEFTFLAAFMPEEITDVEPIEIEDVYITPGTGASIIRLRRKGNRYELTKKTAVAKGDFSRHEEQTIELTRQEYDVLAVGGSLKISKNRYDVKINGFDTEVDVFTEDLEGLVAIDFEFKDNEAQDAFVEPDCCLVDVTQDKEMSAGYLAGKSYKDIEVWLRAKGYKAIT